MSFSCFQLSATTPSTLGTAAWSGIHDLGTSVPPRNAGIAGPCNSHQSQSVGIARPCNPGIPLPRDGLATSKNKGSFNWPLHLQDPYAGGEQSGKHAKPDALSSVVLPPFPLPPPPPPLPFPPPPPPPFPLPPPPSPPPPPPPPPAPPLLPTPPPPLPPPPPP